MEKSAFPLNVLLLLATVSELPLLALSSYGKGKDGAGEGGVNVVNSKG